MTTDTPKAPHGYHIMSKPSSSLCNLRCKYCFYLEKKNMAECSSGRMSDEVLEAYIQKYIASQPQNPEINFAWQGGEPTLMGVDFFKKAVALEKKYGVGRKISNSLQTNGILLDEEWCQFLAKEKFLVGLSIDGPKFIHDQNRIDAKGEPTFDRVMDTLRLLQRHQVDYNTLSCVTSFSAQYPLEVYEFLRTTGTQFMQFIPIVERLPDPESKDIGLDWAEPEDPGDVPRSREVADFSVSGKAYGEFLTAIFNAWVKRDVGRFFVQIIDVALNAWMGLPPPLCCFSPTCGFAMALEHNGDVYTCDHFVYPDHKIGNLVSDEISDILVHPRLWKLGQDKKNALPRQCRECPVKFVCNGGCPKDRFLQTADGEEGLNYLCDGYKAFFTHVDPYMKSMADLLRAGRPAADIMQQFSESLRRRVAAEPEKIDRNAPCPCGSGRAYKKCCGRTKFRR